MKRIVALACALLFGTVTAASVEGTYDVTQRFSGGLTEKAQLKITKTAAALRFEWDGGARVGVGLQLGDYVAVAFGGPNCGVAAYERSGRTFSGVWTMTGKAKGTEKFDWDGQKATRTAVSGANPDGSTYKGQLLLGVQDEYSAVEWQIGDDTTPGVGLLSDDFYAVAFGGEECSVGLYTVMGGVLAGRFFQGEEQDDVPLGEVATPR
ncbi:hypothetical protein [Deinococcus aquaedulcis]|uniref:hypothetical protein n=1 Tax=Deinococcus aquaedulcis TaxID=2840455 RepID=UPI001C83A07F|nr:hypothetical protein [Deinococcus aquaedulcis]